MPVHSHFRRHDRTEMYVLNEPRRYVRFARVLMVPLYRWVARDVAGADLRDGAFVLDVGTGPGRVPLLVAGARPGIRIEGLDLSTAMIAHAEEELQRARARGVRGAERVGYRVGDVAGLPFADASVDLVISTISQHHWPDVAAGLAEIRRVLRPGAQAWIYDFRPALAGAREAAAALDAQVRTEAPLPGTSFLNPVGRLVLRRPARAG
jgi:ubiquinone/menaquinone biosynthesis C-methylase UbiE